MPRPAPAAGSAPRAPAASAARQSALRSAPASSPPLPDDSPLPHPALPGPHLPRSAASGACPGTAGCGCLRARLVGWGDTSGSGRRWVSGGPLGGPLSGLSWRCRAERGDRCGGPALSAPRGPSRAAARAAARSHSSAQLPPSRPPRRPASAGPPTPQARPAAAQLPSRIRRLLPARACMPLLLCLQHANTPSQSLSCRTSLSQICRHRIKRSTHPVVTNSKI